jgi:hypothetical protein
MLQNAVKRPMGHWGAWRYPAFGIDLLDRSGGVPSERASLQSGLMAIKVIERQLPRHDVFVLQMRMYLRPPLRGNLQR